MFHPKRLVCLSICIFILAGSGCYPTQNYLKQAARGQAMRTETESSAVTATNVQQGGGVHAAVAPDSNGVSTAENSDAADRVMIYNANLAMVVLNLDETRKAITKIAKKHGGFLQAMQSNVITIKVPAKNLQITLDAIADFGHVTDRQLVGQDVTEQWHDLHIRLKNAEQAHTRLLALMEKAAKVEDMVKIEKELTRLTETIETIKGKLRWLKEAVAYSTVTVKLNSTLPQDELAIQIPFPWVQHLASELLDGTRPASIDTNLFKRGISFDLPRAYVKYYEQPRMTRALSADGVLIKVHRHENYEGGNLAFWSKLVQRSLVESRAITIDLQAEITLDNGRQAMLCIGRKKIADQMHGYLAAVAPRRNTVYVYEAWGLQSVFSADRQKIETSIKTMH